MELITDLAAFCSLHHEKDIRIIGSSRSVGKQLIARLQRDGVQTDAVREATVAEVACHLMGETHAAVQGMLSPASAQCVLEAVCRDAGDAAAFFAAEREDAAFHAALLTSFDDCIHAGLDPAALPDQVFSSPEKGTAFRFLAEEFSRTCRVRGSITEAMMLREAATISRPPNTAQILLVETTTWDTLTLLQREVLSAAGRLYCFAISSDASGPELRFRRAWGEECELRAAFRDIMQHGNAWDESEIILRDHNQLALAFELTRQFDIPATFDPGIPLQYSKAARTVIAWLRWLADDHDAWHLIRMMYDGVPAPYAYEVDGVKGGRLQMAHLLRSAEIQRGRDTILPRIDRTIADLDATETATDRSVLQAKANRAWLLRLLEITPVETDGFLSLRETARGAHTLITEMCRDKYPGEKEAMLRLAGMLAACADMPDVRLTPEDIARRLTKEIRATVYPMVLQEPGTPAIPVTHPLSGHLHVSLLDHGGWSGRARTWLPGMDAESFASAIAENSVLNDMERRRITATGIADLPLAENAPTRAVAAVRSLLMRCGGTVTLSWSQRRLADKMPRHPSALLLTLLREDRRNTALEMEDLLAAAGAPADIIPEAQPLSSAEKFLVQLSTGREEHIAKELRETFPLLDGGRQAECTALQQGAAPISPLRAVKEFMHAVRALTDPEDPDPLVAFLRGPFCGADDDALSQYAAAGGVFAFNARAIDGTDERISNGLQYIKDSVRLVRSNPPGTVVGSMMERLGLLPWAAVRAEREALITAFRALRDTARRLSIHGHALVEIVRHIDTHSAEEYPVESHGK